MIIADYFCEKYLVRSQGVPWFRSMITYAVPLKLSIFTQEYEWQCLAMSGDEFKISYAIFALIIAFCSFFII